MAVLPTNYLDDILAASMGGKRRFRITHEDGSTEEVTLEDVSEYEQVGSPFGSGDVNKTNQTVNEKLDSADVVDPALATVLGFAADAKLTGDALGELTKNFENSNKLTSISAKSDYSNNLIYFYKKGNKKAFYINGLKNIVTKTLTIICEIPEGYEPDMKFCEENCDVMGVPYRIQESNGKLQIFYYGDTTHQNNLVNVFYY